MEPAAVVLEALPSSNGGAATGSEAMTGDADAGAGHQAHDPQPQKAEENDHEDQSEQQQNGAENIHPGAFGQPFDKESGVHGSYLQSWRISKWEPK